MAFYQKGKRFSTSLGRSIAEGVASNPDVKRVVNRHPVFFGFLRDRLTPRHFSGLPLTLLGLAFIYVLALFLGLVAKIVTSQPVVIADTQLENLLFVFRDARLITFFLWFTFLGEWQLVLLLAGLAAIGLWIRQKRNYVLPLFVAVVGSQIFVALSKIAFHRPRPGGAIPVYIEHSFSFPSGHSTEAMAFYGFLIYFVWRTARQWWQRIVALIIGLVLIFLISFSRLYLGVHFLSDVWGGVLVGALWLIIAMSIREWLVFGLKDVSTYSRRQRKKRLEITMLVLALFIYIGFGWFDWPVLILTSSLTPSPATISQANLKQVFSNNQVSKFTETLGGRAQEPISFIITANNDQQLIATFRQAGWYQAEQVSLKTILKFIHLILTNGSYPAAPITPSFWNHQINDLGFEKPTEANNVRERHHARIWRTHLITERGEPIYVGVVSLDVGIKDFGLTHRIKPDIDTEREQLWHDLADTQAIISSQKEKFVDPLLGKNFAGDQFFTDGQVYIITLR